MHRGVPDVQVAKKSNPERSSWVGITVCKAVQINGLRLHDEGGVASVALEVTHSQSVAIFTSQKAETGMQA